MAPRWITTIVACTVRRFGFFPIRSSSLQIAKSLTASLMESTFSVVVLPSVLRRKSFLTPVKLHQNINENTPTLNVQRTSGTFQIHNQVSDCTLPLFAWNVTSTRPMRSHWVCYVNIEKYMPHIKTIASYRFTKFVRNIAIIIITTLIW